MDFFGLLDIKKAENMPFTGKSTYLIEGKKAPNGIMVGRLNRVVYPTFMNT